MRKEKTPVTLQDIEDAVADWEEAVRWIVKGWDCIEEYTHDLFARETLDKDLADYGDRELPDELRQRIVRADQTFRELTDESNRCVWGDASKYDPTRYWYYYRWQRT